MKEIDYSTLLLDGVDTRDYPDFCDSFIYYGEYIDGSPLSEEDLDRLNEDSDLIYSLVEKVIY